ncbi:MAG: hypothetical protein A2039_07755 [Candidatus Melainabacteria bacterium GWA2_34_9]|nr:MAG: hypothetical protein A2039_07755 [Candidatus Melainabacteria bacterium GWA2_34_9]
MLDLSNISNILNTSPEVLARQIWADTFYSLYIENIWDNVDVWRYISMFSILLLIFYKKKIRFFHSKEEKMERDRSIFINSDLIMTENFLKEFLIELSINETFHKSRSEKIKDFCNYFKHEENKYLNNVLKEPVQNFCINLATLLKFLDEHFFEIHIPEAYRLYPDLKHDPDFNYVDFQDQLYKLCKEAEISYSNYRLTVKAKLSI